MSNNVVAISEGFQDEVEALNGFEWLQVESMRLMEEGADADDGICGNEWLIVAQMREAEEAGVILPLLRALKECACRQVAELAVFLAAA